MTMGFTVSPDMEVQSLEIHKICANFTRLSKKSPGFSIFLCHSIIRTGGSKKNRLLKMKGSLC